jgi:hypothetical protein
MKLLGELLGTVTKTVGGVLPIGWLSLLPWLLLAACATGWLITDSHRARTIDKLIADRAVYQLQQEKNAADAERKYRNAEFEHGLEIARITSQARQEIDDAKQTAATATAALRTSQLRVRHEICAPTGSSGGSASGASTAGAAGPAALRGGPAGPADGASLIGDAIGKGATADALIRGLQKIVIEDRKVCK